jgi:hypothetical protein
MNDPDRSPWTVDPQLEKAVRAWVRRFGYRMRWSRGAVPLWGVNDERPYFSIDIVEADGRDDVVDLIPLDSGDLVVGLINGASGICRGWECSTDRLLDVLSEADEYSKSCKSFADAGPETAKTSSA